MRSLCEHNGKDYRHAVTSQEYLEPPDVRRNKKGFCSLDSGCRVVANDILITNVWLLKLLRNKSVLILKCLSL